MTFALVAALAVALAASVIALGREMRLRKALEKLLTILLSRWRTRATKTETKDLHALDRNSDPDQRL